VQRETDSFVEVLRGALVESRHRVHAAVVDASGRLRSRLGDAGHVTYFRSSAKPFQALPLATDGAIKRFSLTSRELALCCGSHSGEPQHLRTAESILRRAGLDGESLYCGAHVPLHTGTRRELRERGLEPVRLHNNCSGKHAGMMLLARCHGWDPRGYEKLGHPVQDRILRELTRWTELPTEAIGFGTDGCGVPCFAMPLRNMALAYAKLAAAARMGEEGPKQVVEAMTAHPDMVAGYGRLCTELMRCTGGRIFAKLGAEGMYCLGVPGAEIGIALKVEDGAMRAVAPAVIGLLQKLDLITEDDVGVLMTHALPEVTNTCGEVVGQIRPALELLPGDG
jgi:L-asparaginase II